MKKICLKSGETLVETLIAMLIISLVFIFLASSIVSAAKVNSSVKNEDTAFVRDGQSSITDRLSVDGSEVDQKYVQFYETENGYYYYEYKKSN